MFAQRLEVRQSRERPLQRDRFAREVQFMPPSIVIIDVGVAVAGTGAPEGDRSQGVTGHVIDSNPAHAVRGPRYVVTKGQTSVLAVDEARALLNSIPTDTLRGLRDRALIGVMVYTFARVNAVIRMKVKDYFTQGRRGWVRLH